MAGCGKAGCKGPCSVGDRCVSIDQVTRLFANARVVDKKFESEGYAPVVLELAKKAISFHDCKRAQAQKAVQLNEALKVLMQPDALLSTSRKTYQLLGGIENVKKREGG